MPNTDSYTAAANASKLVAFGRLREALDRVALEARNLRAAGAQTLDDHSDEVDAWLISWLCAGTLHPHLLKPGVVERSDEIVAVAHASKERKTQ